MDCGKKRKLIFSTNAANGADEAGIAKSNKNCRYDFTNCKWKTGSAADKRIFFAGSL